MNAVTKGAVLRTLLCALAAAPVHAQLVDAYSTTVEWRQPLGFEVTPIHVVMLPTGKLLFITNYNYFENPGMNLRQPGFEVEYAYVMDTTPANAPPPASVMIQPMANPPPPGVAL